MNDDDRYTCNGPDCEQTSTWGWVKATWLYTSDTDPWTYFCSHACVHLWRKTRVPS